MTADKTFEERAREEAEDYLDRSEWNGSRYDTFLDGARWGRAEGLKEREAEVQLLASEEDRLKTRVAELISQLAEARERIAKLEGPLKLIAEGEGDDEQVYMQMARAALDEGRTEHSLQCKDIPDLPILRFLSQLDGEWATHWEGTVMPSVKDGMPEGIPEKLRLAKMGSLLRRGLVDGCDCGCRGDWEISEKGRAALSALEPRDG